MTNIRQMIRELEDAFPQAVQERGERYQSEGRVELTSVEPMTAEARVVGTLDYNVTITDHGDGKFELWCDCPVGTSTGGICKHVWATLLEVEAQGRPAVRRMLSAGGLATKRQRVKPQEVSNWKRPLTMVREELARSRAVTEADWPEDRRLVYLLDMSQHNYDHSLTIEAATQQRGKNGQWKQPKRFAYTIEQWMNAPDAADRAIAELLHGAESTRFRSNSHRFTVAPRPNSTLLRRLCETGRFFIRHDDRRTEAAPLTWDDGEPWRVAMKMSPTGRGGYTVQGELRRGEESMDLSTPLLLTPTLLVARNKLQRFEDDGGFAFATALRDGGPLRVASHELDDFLATVYRMPRLPRMALPEGMDVQEVNEPLKPQLKIGRSQQDSRAYVYVKELQAELRFGYGDHLVQPHRRETGVFDPSRRSVVIRDLPAEQRAIDLLERVGFTRGGWAPENKPVTREINADKLPRAVVELMQAGWHVEAEGNIYRQPGSVEINASSGIDWFDVQGSVDYDGQRVGLPALLEALRRGERTVVLNDGSVGLLPEQWLKQHAPVLNLAETEGEALRFRRGQVGFLDALLAAEPEATCDEAVQQARRELAQFSGVAPVAPPDTFVGELRPYQLEGLGWLEFLQRFSFGGCLADDMGLGKTVQVLAMLERRRAASAGPSLVVAPRSLIFNWRQEANRFTPQMRVLDFTGLGRHSSIDGLDQHDLVLTTYGTLRRDADMLKNIRFDYVVLDEAQAIKNASTASAKAARLLKADHRLALSGTPVENRIDDLWSIFEFLNPGMLGTLRAFKGFSTTSNGDGAEHGRDILSRVTRPFILRRTKQQVATDLPQKSEQTIYCELDVKQRKLYDDLRDHYRATLLGQIDRVGLNKSKIMVLEALLRLRQAACHPALVNPKHADAGSAKIEAMLEQVNEALSEGHKVLVFSQFTKLLSIVRKEFDDQQVSYEYLDGRTRDRQEKVERFQNDPDCKLFLISLKAGGLGLNLTAADYVFLLDPWWNPAVEAQAIDRSHRIGQTRPVFAYRLIARDTVEEKVLELQNSKRELAEAIITADNSLISRLTRDDLQLLLS